MTDDPTAVPLPDEYRGPADPPRTSRRAFAAAVVCAGISFFAFGAIRAPVPAVNEPHYLAKARHYWNPDWCRGDFFLDSANAHLVFYQTFGWPTQWLSLEQTAWLGRAVAALILAIGWCRWAGSLLPGRWTGVWSAWVFLLAAACGNLSGEWIAGGVESKVVAYGLLFWGLAFGWERSWKRAALCAGLAISFHPVVGMWGLIAFVGGEKWAWLMRRFAPQSTAAMPATPGPIAALSLASLILIAAALPGLVPALSLVGNSSFAADYIQIYYRLDHHLDPMQFPVPAYVAYALLLAFWCIGRRWCSFAARERLFSYFVLTTVAVAVVGLAVGYYTGAPEDLPWLPLRMKFLKLYPFRMCDTLIPMAAAITAVGLVTARAKPVHDAGQHVCATRTARPWVLFGSAILAALLLPAQDRNASRLEPQRLADWLDACRWISRNTPEGTTFLTPTQASWAFKWYAERAEFVSFKDCPQDAAGIVEWNNRLVAIRDWAQGEYRDGYDAKALGELWTRHGITHVVTDRLGPISVEPIYRNETYRVYSVPGAGAARNSPEADP